MRRLALVVVTLALACGEDPLAGGIDATVAADSGLVDRADASATDDGIIDAGPRDFDTDAGTNDAAFVDATADAGSEDIGLDASGPVDFGMAADTGDFDLGEADAMGSADAGGLADIGGTADTGGAADVGQFDAGPSDAGSIDTGGSDTGLPADAGTDAGPTDTGSGTDSGINRDGGDSDGSIGTDAGTPDFGPPDVGDAGAPDAAASDAGSTADAGTGTAGLWIEIDYRNAFTSRSPQWSYSNSPGWGPNDWDFQGSTGTGAEAWDRFNNMSVVTDPLGTRVLEIGSSGQLQLMFGVVRLTAYTRVLVEIQGRSRSCCSRVTFNVTNPALGTCGVTAMMNQDWTPDIVQLDLTPCLTPGSFLQAIRVDPTSGTVALQRMRLTIEGAVW